MLIVKQDYSDLEFLVKSKKTPHVSSIAVIIPFFNKNDTAFDKLLLTLASLSYQDYPRNLFNITVAFDGPKSFHAFSKKMYSKLDENGIDYSNIQIVNVDSGEENWGKSYAFNKVLAFAHSDLVLSLDSDMVLDRNYLKTLARWFVTDSNLVVFGSKKIVPTYNSVSDSLKALADGNFDEIPTREPKDHDWFVNFIEKTDGFKNAGSSVFSVFVGAAVMMNRSFLQNLGGYDESMKLAEDTELGYRLHNAGAIFIPDLDSKAWHLGETAMMKHRDKLLEHNHALLAQRVPLLRKLRKNKNHIIYKTPTAVVNIKSTEATADSVVTLAGDILNGMAGFDARIHIVLPSSFSEYRYSPLNDSFQRTRRMVNELRFDRRVSFSSTVENFDCLSPFVMVVNKPVSVQFLKKMFTLILAKDVGFVGLPSLKGRPIVAIYRQAALARLGIRDLDNFSVNLKNISSIWGFWWVSRFDLVKQSAKKNDKIGALRLNRRVKRKVRKLKNKIHKK